VLRLAELERERLADEAEKPKHQDAENADAAGQGPWRLFDPRCHARSRA
jgi:hypothetical protein